jgi:hypothetical protein
MGFDCGFDIYPRLDAANESDKRAYREFLDEIIDTYKDAYDDEGRRKDGKVLQLPGDAEEGDFPSNDYICFMVGECPKMLANPEQCGYFLRFSSRISGSLTQCAEPYIRSVRQIAEKHFGDRVHSWHELNEMADDPRKWMGCYDWATVNEAEEKLRALGTGQEEGGQSRSDGNGQRMDSGAATRK